MTVFQILFMIVVSIALLAGGVVCLVWPQALRRLDLIAEANAAKRVGSFYKPWLALRTWARGGRAEPLWWIRVNGVALVIGLIVIWGAFVLRACR